MDENKYEIIGQIEGVEEKLSTTKNKVFKKIKIQGQTFNVFDEKLFDFLKVGEYIKAKYNKSTVGEYIYKSIFYILKSSEAEMNNQTQPTIKQSIKSESVDQRTIVKQNVLHRAVDMFIADKIEKEEIIKTANNFLSWVYDKFGETEDEEEINSPIPAEDPETVEDFKDEEQDEILEENIDCP